jgi:hypothetical protein
MATRTIYIAEQDGTITKVTELSTSKGVHHITVEVSKEKTAYGMVIDGDRPAVGSRVRFSGEAVIEIGPGGLEKKDTYYHIPVDGTPVQDWTYRELTLSHLGQVKRIGPEKLMQLISTTIDGVAALNYDYEANWNDHEHLEYLIDSLEQLANEARSKLIRLHDSQKDVISGI